MHETGESIAILRFFTSEKILYSSESFHHLNRIKGIITYIERGERLYA